MVLFLLLGGCFAASFGSYVCNKKNSNVFTGEVKRGIYFLIVAVWACFFFWMINGFSISVNRITWLYALAFSVVCFLSSLVNLIIYHFAKIPTVSVVNSTLSLITTSLLGTLLFSEKIGWSTVLRIVLLVCASLLLYRAATVNEKKEQAAPTDGPASDGAKKPYGIGRKLCFVLLMAVLIGVSCSSTLLTKSFSVRDDVSDVNSYYFATNVFLFGGGIVWLLVASRARFGQFCDGLTGFRPVYLLFIVLATLCGNISSLLTIPLLDRLEVASYSAYTSAIGITASAVASLVYREKQNVWSVSAILLAVVSFLLGAFL